MDRVILHSDANCFFASVETVLDPRLIGRAVAVCGDPEKRHGIVLAKSEAAKRAGVKTGMANWQAKELCPELIIVPPQYAYYVKYSGFLREIYRRYTDRVEPFGLDECWLDVSGCRKAPAELADEIRETVKEELGITVSIGVSFNKAFAKLGSDMKKPDAVTEISRENFRTKVWPLPCSDLLFCGRATAANLRSIGVRTIGELAALPEDLVRRRLGKNGITLWRYARGEDSSEVLHQDHEEAAKSVGHGITCVTDLVNTEEAHKVIVALAQDVGYKLRLTGMAAGGVQLVLRESDLSVQGFQLRLREPTQDEAVLITAADALLRKHYAWEQPLRMLTVSAIFLQPADTPRQQSLFVDYTAEEKRAKLLSGLDKIRERYGKQAVMPASMIDEEKMPKGYEERVVMLPGGRKK